jgi:hypothetical protein
MPKQAKVNSDASIIIQSTLSALDEYATGRRLISGGGAGTKLLFVQDDTMSAQQLVSIIVLLPRFDRNFLLTQPYFLVDVCYWHCALCIAETFTVVVSIEPNM